MNECKPLDGGPQAVDDLFQKMLSPKQDIRYANQIGRCRLIL